MILDCVNPKELNWKTCIESKKEKEEKDKFVTTHLLPLQVSFSAILLRYSIVDSSIGEQTLVTLHHLCSG